MKQKTQNLKQWALQGSCRHQTVARLHRTPCQNWIWHLLPSHPNSRVCQHIRSRRIEMSHHTNKVTGKKMMNAGSTEQTEHVFGPQFTGSW